MYMPVFLTPSKLNTFWYLPQQNSFLNIVYEPGQRQADNTFTSKPLHYYQIDADAKTIEYLLQQFAENEGAFSFEKIRSSSYGIKQENYKYECILVNAQIKINDKQAKILPLEKSKPLPDLSNIPQAINLYEPYDVASSENQISLLKKTIEHYKKEIEITSSYIKAPLFLDGHQFNIPSITDKTPISIILIGANAVFALSNKNKFRCHIVQGTIIPQRGPYKDSTQISHITGYFNEDGYWYSSSSEKSYQNEKLIKTVDLKLPDHLSSDLIDFHEKSEQKILENVRKEHFNNRLFNLEKAIKPLLLAKLINKQKSHTYAMMIMHDKGLDLSNFLKTNPFLSLEERLYYICRVIEKIINLHQQGYVHLDLKLENICINNKYEKKEVSIIDYESLLYFLYSETDCIPGDFENHDKNYQHPLSQKITHFTQHDNWAAYLIYKTLLWIDEDIKIHDMLPIHLQLTKKLFQCITKDNHLENKQFYDSLIFLYSMKEELNYFQIKNSLVFLLSNFARQQSYDKEELISDKFYGHLTLLKNIYSISHQYHNELESSVMHLTENLKLDCFIDYFPQSTYHDALISLVSQENIDIKSIKSLMSCLYIQQYRDNIIELLKSKNIDEINLFSIYNVSLAIDEINFSTKNIFFIITYLLQIEAYLLKIQKNKEEYRHSCQEIEKLLITIFTKFTKEHPSLAEYCLYHINDEYYSHWQYATQFAAVTVDLLESAIFKNFSNTKNISTDYFERYFSQSDYYNTLKKIISNEENDFEAIASLFSCLHAKKYRDNIIHLLSKKNINKVIINEISDEKVPITKIKLTPNNIHLIKIYLLQMEEHLSILKIDDIDEYQSIYQEVQIQLTNIFSQFRKDHGYSAACDLIDIKIEYHAYWAFRKQKSADTLLLLDEAIVYSIPDPILEETNVKKANMLVASPVLNSWSKEGEPANKSPTITPPLANQIETTSLQTP